MILGEIKVGLRLFCVRVIVQDDCWVGSGLGPKGMGGRPDEVQDLPGDHPGLP